MRHIIFFLLILVSDHVFSQACKMPSALDQIRPDRCGIRYVKAEGSQVNVILEFEKKTRILTPDNPNDVRGKSVNLIGLYYLTYDQAGEILEEKRVFVQTGEIPDRGLVFGLNGQRGELLESELNLISLEDYNRVPWGGSVKSTPKNPINARSSAVFFETELNVDKALRITDLQIAKLETLNITADTVPVFRKKTSLFEYDSCTKKRFWTNQYLSVTDPVEGFTLAMLNHYDKDVEKDISEKLLRLVSFDSNGQVAGSHQFEFESPMFVVYRNETFQESLDGISALDKQIWVLKAKTYVDDSHKLGQYYYYSFDKKAQLNTSAVVVSRHHIFDPLNVFWQDEGVFYMSNTNHEIVSCFIENSGKYHINSSGERLGRLREFIQRRSQNGNHSIELDLHQQPTVFEDGNVLMIYRVQENVGVAAGVQLSAEMAAATLVDHGFVVVLLNPQGLIKEADFYHRPQNADPRSLMELGPVEKNEAGCISFYATDKTSDGIYPVFCTIQHNKVSFVRSKKGPITSRQIYYDANEAVVGYFGLKKDPADPRISVRTLEILREGQ